jgi:hypothetical protein
MITADRSRFLAGLLRILSLEDSDYFCSEDVFGPCSGHP